MRKQTIFWIIVLIILASVLFYQDKAQSESEPIQSMTWTIVEKCEDQIIEETFVKRNWIKNDLVTKAFEISNGDLDFILTVEAESSWNPKAIGDHWNSKWLCQWHQKWQKSVRNDPNFEDPDWQLQKCFEFYQWYKEAWIIHKRLYWYNVRLKKKNLFEVQTVQTLVSNCWK